jgi:hypothetical protein
VATSVTQRCDAIVSDSAMLRGMKKVMDSLGAGARPRLSLPPALYGTDLRQ